MVYRTSLTSTSVRFFTKDQSKCFPFSSFVIENQTYVGIKSNRVSGKRYVLVRFITEHFNCDPKMRRECVKKVPCILVPLATERTCEPKGKSQFFLGQGSDRGTTYPLGTLILPLLSSKSRKNKAINYESKVREHDCGGSNATMHSTFEFGQGSVGQIKAICLSLMCEIKTHLNQFLQKVNPDVLIGII